jgi:hypothetical protein
VRSAAVLQEQSHILPPGNYLPGNQMYTYMEEKRKRREQKNKSRKNLNID